MSTRAFCSAAAAAAILAVLAGGCAAGAGDAGKTSDPQATCALDSSLLCGSGSDGWSCMPGESPDMAQGGLSCSVPVTLSDGSAGFCCWSGALGSSASTCASDDSVTAACSSDSWGYSCDIGDDPTSLDPTLTCSIPVRDRFAGEDTFCCW